MTAKTPKAPHPEVAALLAADDGGEHPQLWDVPVDVARRFYRAMMTDGRDEHALAPVAETHDQVIRTAGGDLPCRVHRPPRPRGRTVVYFHGGGWALGDLDTHDDVARSLCHELGAVVVSVHLPQPPEVIFPGPVESAVEAITYVDAVRADLGGAGGPLIVAGDSSGANVATVAVRHLARTRPGMIAAQFLLYPLTDASGGYPDTMRCGRGYWFEAAHARWFLEQYLPDPGLTRHPDVSPARSPQVDVLPPTVIVTAEFDLLRDEGRHYADVLRAAGVPVVYREAEGMVHGFFGMADRIPDVREEVRRCCAGLDRLLTAEGWRKPSGEAGP